MHQGDARLTVEVQALLQRGAQSGARHERRLPDENMSSSWNLVRVFHGKVCVGGHR